MTPPLDGVRVLEIAEAVAGPYCAMALGDAGAAVTKVEPPAGDRSREWGSHTRGDYGAVYMGLNRNKRSIALDAARPEADEVLRRLVRGTDVVVIDAGLNERDGLRYEHVRRQNPRAIYLVVSEYGPHGPWANRPPYGELAAQLASEATTSLGAIGEPPVRLGTDVGGMYAAIYGVQAIGAALLARERTGEGQRIDVSLFGTLLAMRSTLWVALSNPDFWWGFHLDSYVKPPDHGYACKDGRIFFSLPRATPEQREALYRALDMEWVHDDPRFAMFHQDAGGGSSRYGYVFTDLWERAFARFTADEVIDLARQHGGWAFRMNDYETLMESEQVRAAGMLTTIERPDGGEVRTMLPPWELTDTPAEIRRRAPRLGEHGREILGELGFGAAEVASLVATGVVRA